MVPETVQRAPNKMLTTRSDDDEIVRHLLGRAERHEMSPAVQNKFAMMQACEKLIRKHVSRSKVIPLLETQLEISQTTAYKLFADTQRLFGETSIKNQPFWVDIELGALEEDIQAAKVLKDYKSVAALRKIKADFILKAMGSGDAQLYETIQPPPFVIGFFPRSMKVKLPRDKELSKRLSDKLNQIAEDVEYTE